MNSTEIHLYGLLRLSAGEHFDGMTINHEVNSHGPAAHRAKTGHFSRIEQPGGFFADTADFLKQ